MTTGTTARHRRWRIWASFNACTFVIGYCLNVPDIHSSVHIMTIGITQRRDQNRTMSASYVKIAKCAGYCLSLSFSVYNSVHFFRGICNPKTGPRQNDVCILPTIVMRVTCAHICILCEALRLLTRQCL